MSDQSRRKLLKTIAAGSGAIIAGTILPDKWTKPVVNSIILPAHAQATTQPPTAPTCQDDPTLCAGTYTGTLNPAEPFIACGTGGGVGIASNAVSITISATGQVSGTQGGTPFTPTTLAGNSFTFPPSPTGAGTGGGGTTCEMFLLASGSVNSSSNEITLSQVYEWVCTGTNTCTNQLDNGTSILT
jgi:hypothetical protein